MKKPKWDRGLGIRITIMVTEETRERLNAVSRSSGAPRGEVIRRAIEAYLKK